jgi:hypothetical protein
MRRALKAERNEAPVQLALVDPMLAHLPHGIGGFYGLWCMNRGNTNEINTLRFSALNRKT